MNATHELIVQRFRAGESMAAISQSVGYSARHIRNIVTAAIPMRRRGKRFQFQSRPDGEYCQCGRCARLGYGVDAWHPATEDFWPMDHGRLSFSACKACRSEIMARSRGVVQVRGAA